MSVRGAVMTQLENHRRIRFVWVAAIAAGISVAIVVPSFLSDHSDRPAKVAPAEGRRTETVRSAHAPKVPFPRARKTRRAPAARTDSGQGVIAALDRMYEPERSVATAPNGTVVLTLPTMDPNVVIVLFDDRTGGTE